ncbi:MAG: class I SAM-dependent RNA methyltransferase [Verrucomicrobia bacterium]|nr:class I SAM-dependent RNA methyltransferase [Verrucomicrobiota bacterium]
MHVPPDMPFQPGQSLVTRVVDLAFGGEGVARHEQFVIFVPFVLPGEEVEITITEVHKNYARARTLRLLTESPDRVTPVCSYFGACGGCQYQHLRYERQLELKHRQVVELLRRVGHFPEPPVRSPIPCPVPYEYRNRIMVRSQWNGPEQRLVVGYLRHDNRFVVDVERCAIAEPALNQQLLEVRRRPPPKGGLKVTLRIPPEDWEVPPDSFFQNNFHLLPALVQTVGQSLAGSGVRHLIDAYCGVGFFAISLARQIDSFIGIELDKPAIRSARANAAARAIVNGEFICGAVEELLPDVVRRLDPGHTAVLLDPPRRGCLRSGLDTLLAAGPAQIIYVSCHPATLARDLNILCRDGVYHFVDLTPLDMFPQTQHVECVADLRRTAARPGISPI